MVKKTLIKAYQVLDNFIADENKKTGLAYYRNKKGNNGPEDVMFLDKSLTDMVISVGVELNNVGQPEGTVFSYDTKYDNLANRLVKKLKTDINLDSTLEKFY
jgi:hypothetical protein